MRFLWQLFTQITTTMLLSGCSSSLDRVITIEDCLSLDVQPSDIIFIDGYWNPVFDEGDPAYKEGVKPSTTQSRAIVQIRQIGALVFFIEPIGETDGRDDVLNRPDVHVACTVKNKVKILKPHLGTGNASIDAVTHGYLSIQRKGGIASQIELPSDTPFGNKIRKSVTRLRRRGVYTEEQIQSEIEAEKGFRSRMLEMQKCRESYNAFSLQSCLLQKTSVKEHYSGAWEADGVNGLRRHIEVFQDGHLVLALLKAPMPEDTWHYYWRWAVRLMCERDGVLEDIFDCSGLHSCLSAFKDSYPAYLQRWKLAGPDLLEVSPQVVKVDCPGLAQPNEESDPEARLVTMYRRVQNKSGSPAPEEQKKVPAPDR